MLLLQLLVLLRLLLLLVQLVDRCGVDLLSIFSLSYAGVLVAFNEVEREEAKGKTRRSYKQAVATNVCFVFIVTAAGSVVVLVA